MKWKEEGAYPSGCAPNSSNWPGILIVSNESVLALEVYFWVTFRQLAKESRGGGFGGGKVEELFWGVVCSFSGRASAIEPKTADDITIQ